MAFLGAIAPMISVVSGVVGAMGAIASANAQAAAASYNAQVEQQNAKMAMDQGAMDDAMRVQKMRQRVAYSTAAALQNGVEISGSTLDVINQMKDQGFMEGLMAVYDGSVKATGHINNAKLYQLQAQSAQTAGMIGAGSQLLGGLSDAYKTSQLQV